VTGPDGNVWFTEFNTEQLSRITPAGVVTDVQKARGGPFGIARAADGTIWLTLLSGNKIGQFSLR
jgi:virginiamycin B lyase